MKRPRLFLPITELIYFRRIDSEPISDLHLTRDLYATLSTPNVLSRTSYRVEFCTEKRICVKNRIFVYRHSFVLDRFLQNFKLNYTVY